MRVQLPPTNCRTLPTMKVREAIRLLADDGWYLKRQRGSHRQYVHPVKPGKVTVAGGPSETLHPKTQASIMRQAGLGKRGEG